MGDRGKYGLGGTPKSGKQKSELPCAPHQGRGSKFYWLPLGERSITNNLTYSLADYPLAEYGLGRTPKNEIEKKELYIHTYVNKKQLKKTLTVLIVICLSVHLADYPQADYGLGGARNIGTEKKNFCVYTYRLPPGILRPGRSPE